jgi:uncharacterized protein YybS (DUF2232 family)
MHYLYLSYLFILNPDRIWVIWAHSYLIVAMPFLLMVLAAGDLYRSVGCKSPVINVIYLTIPGFSFSDADSGRIDSFNIVPSILIVVNTCLCTMLIAGRIW